MQVESHVANQYLIKVPACCHKLSFRFITGKDRYQILSKSDLTKVQVPFAVNQLFNKLYFFINRLRHFYHKGLQ